MTGNTIEDALLIVPVRNVVLFPGVVLPVTIGRDKSLAAAQEAVRTRRRVGLLLQKDPSQDHPTVEQLHRIGTCASIVRFVTAPDGTHHMICQGEQRFEVLDYISQDPFLVARVQTRNEPATVDLDTEARGMSLREKAAEALPQAPAELLNAIQSIESVPALADVVASFLDIKAEEKQEILATFDLKARLDRILAIVSQRIEVLKMSRQIDERTRTALDERQKEIILRERLKQIREELGDAGGSSGSGVARACAPGADAVRGRRVFDGAHVPGLADRRSVVKAR
jgi:ATP-dependent Lon protease